MDTPPQDMSMPSRPPVALAASAAAFVLGAPQPVATDEFHGFIDNIEVGRK